MSRVSTSQSTLAGRPIRSTPSALRPAKVLDCWACGKPGTHVDRNGGAQFPYWLECVCGVRWYAWWPGETYELMGYRPTHEGNGPHP
jgi:hypothetical protein